MQTAVFSVTAFWMQTAVFSALQAAVCIQNAEGQGSGAPVADDQPGMAGHRVPLSTGLSTGAPRACSIPVTAADQGNSSARARAAARRDDSRTSSSPQIASANARASSTTAAPQFGSTISGSAEEWETTTGVPDASASSAAKPKVS